MRSFRSVALVLGLAIPVLAGCFGGGEDDGNAGPGGRGPPLTFRDDWAERAVPYTNDVMDHDHFDPAQHQGLSTPNFQELGWDPLISEHYGRSAGGYLCGDSVSTGERKLAAVHGIGTDVAFELVDVTDPATPTVLGEFVMPRAASRDVALTPDGGHVAVAISTPDAQEANAYTATPVRSTASTPEERALDEAGTAYWRSPCNAGPVPVGRVADLVRVLADDTDIAGTELADLADAPETDAPEDEAPWPPGVMLVSVSDPKAPVIVSFYPLPVLGAHSVYAGELEGRTIVIASVVNLATAVSNFWFLEVTETPVGQRLVLLSLYQEQAQEGGAPPLNGHNDGVLQKHPVTGQPLAWLANWHQGVAILDMSDPRAPQVIGRWDDNTQPLAGFDPDSPPYFGLLVEDGSGDVHEAIPLDTTWNGRHYTFVGQEILARPTGTPSGLVNVLDTTDPTNPVAVAVWTLPVDVEWDASLVFSTHYLSFYEKTVFVAHYHAGVWAIDMSCLPDCKHPPAVGAYIPANVSPKPPPDGPYDWTPTIMDANSLRDGTLVVWDSSSGIYTVAYDTSQPAPPRVFAGFGDGSAAL